MKRFNAGAICVALASLFPIHGAAIAVPPEPEPGPYETLAECEQAMAFHRAGRREENGTTRYYCVEDEDGYYHLRITRIAR